MKNDILGIGEVLIDFTPIGKGHVGNPAYEMNPGGAPANMLSAYCALGGSAKFIGAVGSDFFADFIRKKLSESRIDISSLVTIDGANTTLAYIWLNEDMQPSYHFIRDNGADAMLESKMIDLKAIDECRVLHFGGVSLSAQKSCEAVMYAAHYAKDKGKLITFDANYRQALWSSKNEAEKKMKEAVELADIIKLSEEEAFLLTGESSTKEAAKKLFSYGKKAIFITLGKKGVYFIFGQEQGLVEAYDVIVKDTTGCGDAFMGAVLFQLLNEPAKMAHEIVRYANAVSALCATKYGAIPAMPSRNEVNDFLMGDNDL